MPLIWNPIESVARWHFEKMEKVTLVFGVARNREFLVDVWLIGIIEISWRKW